MKKRDVTNWSRRQMTNEPREYPWYEKAAALAFLAFMALVFARGCRLI